MLSEKANAELLAYLTDFDILTTGPFDYKDQITIRCKTCGAVLNRIVNGIFDNSKNHGGKYACVECKKLYNQRPEVKRAKYRENGRRERERKRSQKEAAKQKRNAEELERRKQVVTRCGAFEYVGNYTGSEGTADVRCLICGAIITRSWTTIKQGAVACDNCKRLTLEEKQRQQQKEQERKQTKALLKREDGFDQLAFSVCECCGGLFIPPKRGIKYCSRDCRERVNNAVKKDRRLRRMARDDADKITLERLFDRDGGVCYICGGVCEWTDGEQRESAFIAGNKYPSIDHVIPLSRGGAHVWGNVRLAHRICNTVKGATYPPCR